jgi:uncharacterized protein (TIGR03435 family)
MMSGPMLQALLEDRFKLKIQRAEREVPVYEVTVAKAGLKMKRVDEGSCVPESFSPPAPAQKPTCGVVGSTGRKGPNGEIQELDLRTNSLDELCGTLQRFLDRPVLNKTGLRGRFNIHLEFLRDLTPSDDPAPSIFTALQEQLGLKLEPAKGPGEFLVVDSVDRPSEN